MCTVRCAHHHHSILYKTEYSNTLAAHLGSKFSVSSWGQNKYVFSSGCFFFAREGTCKTDFFLFFHWFANLKFCINRPCEATAALQTVLFLSDWVADDIDIDIEAERAELFGSTVCWGGKGGRGEFLWINPTKFPSFGNSVSIILKTISCLQCYS